MKVKKYLFSPDETKYECVKNINLLYGFTHFILLEIQLISRDYEFTANYVSVKDRGK